MAKVRFELNRAGVAELLKSKEMQSVLDGFAAASLAKLGEGYEAKAFTGFDRAQVTIRTATEEARKDNSENNSLLKAVR